MTTQTNYLPLGVYDETAPLRAVIVGVGTDISRKRHLINPREAEAVAAGTFPTQDALRRQVQGLAETLSSHGVDVYHPHNIPDSDQIFTRDVAFVIGERLVRAHMAKPSRRDEYAQLDRVTARIDPACIIEPPSDVVIEGGDVVLGNALSTGRLFVGLGERTNGAGVDFLRREFPTWETIPLPLVVTDDAHTNVLHLDCAFQPVGAEHAILYEAGFRSRPEALLDLYPDANLIRVSGEEMYYLNPNVFSLSPEVVVSEPGFARLNDKLRRAGLTVVETPYAEVAKLGGLFRCSTLPLRRG